MPNIIILIFTLLGGWLIYNTVTEQIVVNRHIMEIQKIEAETKCLLRR